MGRLSRGSLVHAYREIAETMPVRRRKRHPALDVSSLAAGIALGIELDALWVLAAVVTARLPMRSCHLSASLALGALVVAACARSLARRARLETSLAPERYQPPCARAARSVARLSEIVGAVSFVDLVLSIFGGMYC